VAVGYVKTGIAPKPLAAEPSAADQPTQWVNWRSLAIAVVAISAVGLALRVYQQYFAWDYGMDAFEPEFQTYWMNLLYLEFALEFVAAAVIWTWIWVTRDRNLDKITPREELRRMFSLIVWVSAYVFIFAWGSHFAEQDASWHQVTIRDTDFTPSHIVLFYGVLPAANIAGVTAWIWARTRVPMYSKGIPIAFTIGVVGPFLALPNVAFNEWGHTFWFMEELFSHPLHYGFVVFGWSALALGGFLLQGMKRIVQLTGWKSADPEYNAPFPVVSAY
jgi:methane/ammonia monooxygenase subunit C